MRNIRRGPVLVGAFLCAVFTPSVALANMALPVAVVMYPASIVMLIPIVLIEGFILSWLLTVRARRALTVSVASNAVSTLIGLPAAGFLSAFLPLTWISNVYPSTPWWQRPWIAVSIVVVIFFFASWFTEYLVSRRMLRDFDVHRVNMAVLLGNLATYALLILVYLAVSFL